MARPRDPGARDPDRRSGAGPWRPVTRRAFVTALGTALGAAATALAIRGGTRWAGSDSGAADDDRPPRRVDPVPGGETRWIGHC